LAGARDIHVEPFLARRFHRAIRDQFAKGGVDFGLQVSVVLTDADAHAFAQGRVIGGDDVDIDKLKACAFGLVEEALQCRDIGMSVVK
jgi:hypothetical protein